MLKSVILSLFFVFCFSACSNEEGLSSKIEISVTPTPPSVIYADFPYLVGSEVVTIVGPWSNIGFDFTNNHTEVVTILTVTFTVDGPDGKTRTSVNYGGGFQFGDSSFLLSMIKPEGDRDCDGIDERFFDKDGKEVPAKSKEGAAPATCELDEKNMSVTGGRMFISDLLSGVDKDNRSEFGRGLYNVTAKFEGWFGPFDNPKSNLVKEIRFDIISN